MTYLDPFPQGTRISQEFRAAPGGYNPPGGHTGRDYAVPVGTPVRAAADGIIRHSDWFGDYAANPWWLTRYGGDTIVLDCGDDKPTFVYAHLSDSIAAVGQRVVKGQIIALSGNSGTATSGPHCHVERLNPGFDLTSDVYGRAPLNFDEFYDASTIPAPIIQALGDRMATLDKDDLDKIGALVVAERKTTVLEVRANATATVNAVADLVEDAVYKLSVFTQKTDNGNTDRSIDDFRAELRAGIDEIKAQHAAQTEGGK